MVQKSWQAKGIRNGKSKLNERKVKLISRLYSTRNVSYKTLATLFGVRRETIGAIVREEYWKLPKVE